MPKFNFVDVDYFQNIKIKPVSDGIEPQYQTYYKREVREVQANCVFCEKGFPMGNLQVLYGMPPSKVLKEPTSETWKKIYDAMRESLKDLNVKIVLKHAPPSNTSTITKDQMAELLKALEAGNYNAAPSKLSQGDGTVIPDQELADIIRGVTYNDIHLSKKKKCVCGAHKTGIKDYATGHSDWCDVRAKR